MKKRSPKKPFYKSSEKVKKDDQNYKAPHWEFSKKSKEYVNIHLLWSKKK